MILNKHQQAAINDDSQVYFLQAGAGTGKTTTLMAKHRNEVLLSDKRMLITSFTRHVIENIEAQINFCGYTEYKTIHGLALKVISYYYYLKEKGSFEIESNSDYLIKKTILKIFKDKNYLATKKKVDDLLKQIKKINKGILESNDDVIENDKKNDKEERKLTLNELYESIRKEQKEKNAFTFDELIYLATKLLERDFSLRDYFSSLYDYIFIDEFQDLTINQLNLIVYLNFKKNKGFFVGDFNQQINSFQGSDLNYSKDFLKLINAKYGCLKENYRNPKVILDSSNNLIEQKLSLNNREQGELLHETFSTEQKELDYIFDKIKIMLKCGIKEEQIAVIAPQRAIYTKLLREVQKSGLFNIRFATIHRVKGLEYDYVFLMGCEDTYFKYDNMEHKRLFYVAMTRAKKRLILSTVYNRKNYYFYYAMLPKQEKIKQLLHQEEIQKLSLDKLSQVGLKKLGFDSYSFSLLKQMSLFNLSQDLLKKLDVLDLCQDELKAVLMQDKEIKSLLKKQCIELLIKNVLGDFVIEYMKALIPVKSKACYYLTDIKIKDGIKAYLVKEILNVNLGLNDITISKTVKDEIEKLKDDYLSLYSSSKSDDYFRKFYSALVYSKETDNGLFIKRQTLGYNLWRINMEYQLFRIKKKHIEVKDGLDYDSKSKDKKKDDKRYIIKSKKNAYEKLIYNFKDAKCVSFVSFNLSDKNTDGSDSKDRNNIDKLSLIYREFIKAIREIVGFEFKHFRIYELTQKGNLHYHCIFDFDVMEKLGYDDYCLKNNKDYQFYYGSVPAGFTLYRVKGKKPIPIFNKIFAKIVAKHFPNLKKMSPIPQGIKVYKKITNKISHIISNFKKINKKTIMCYNKVEANIPFIKLVSEYVTKYTTKNENKNNQKELKEQLNNKDEKQESLLDKLIKIFRKKKRRLFVFSRNCRQIPIKKEIKHYFKDINLPDKHLNSLNVYDFKSKKVSYDHPLKKIVKYKKIKNSLYLSFYYSSTPCYEKSREKLIKTLTNVYQIQRRIIKAPPEIKKLARNYNVNFFSILNYLQNQ